MNTIKRWRQSVAVLAAGLLGVAGQAPAQRGSAEGGPVVQTSEGPVRGFVKNGVYEFLGVPYAAAPVGARRWRPPQPPKTRSALLDATAYRNICAQTTTLGVFAGPASVSEDCLFLNIFTTRLGSGIGRDEPNAVLVWIHGGGNIDGASNDYDGSKLATGGPLGRPTVVVTVNYRLGLLGYLAHPALDNEGHPFGNYGIMDIQAALYWVQQNIAAFGGDPTRVALGGQSAGASNTGMNVISPVSAGLFNRAIFESSPTNSAQPLSLALTRGMSFATAAGCPGTSAATAACLRALSVAQILQLQGTANANGPYVTGPMVDGTIVPITPITAWTTGQFNHMPMMGGNVQDEATFGIGITEYFSGPPQAPITAAQYVTNVTNTYSGSAYPGGPNYPSGTAAAVLAEYPPGADPQATFDLVGTHPGACRNRHIYHLWSQWVPVYAYEFNYQQAPYYFPPLPGFAPLAAHTIDIQFLFPGWRGGILGINHSPQNTWSTGEISGPEITLSDQLVAAWTKFAATGNPNGVGNSPWPRYVGQEGVPEYLSENVPSLSTFTNAEFSANHRCDFWDTIIVYQP